MRSFCIFDAHLNGRKAHYRNPQGKATKAKAKAATRCGRCEEKLSYVAAHSR